MNQEVSDIISGFCELIDWIKKTNVNLCKELNVKNKGNKFIMERSDCFIGKSFSGTINHMKANNEFIKKKINNEIIDDGFVVNALETIVDILKEEDIYTISNIIKVFQNNIGALVNNFFTYDEDNKCISTKFQLYVPLYSLFTKFIGHVDDVDNLLIYVEQLLRHELGHVIDSYSAIGLSRDERVKIDEQDKTAVQEFEKWVKKEKPNNYDYRVKYHQLPAEYRANQLGKVNLDIVLAFDLDEVWEYKIKYTSSDKYIKTENKYIDSFHDWLCTLKNLWDSLCKENFIENVPIIFVKITHFLNTTTSPTVCDFEKFLIEIKNSDLDKIQKLIVICKYTDYFIKDLSFVVDILTSNICQNVLYIINKNSETKTISDTTDLQLVIYLERFFIQYILNFDKVDLLTEYVEQIFRMKIGLILQLQTYVGLTIKEYDSLEKQYARDMSKHKKMTKNMTDKKEILQQYHMLPEIAEQDKLGNVDVEKLINIESKIIPFDYIDNINKI